MLHSAYLILTLASDSPKGDVLVPDSTTSVYGIHAITCGLPVLLEVLSEQGKLLERPKQLDERRQHVKDDFQKKRGFWAATWDNLLQFDPDFLEAYTVSCVVLSSKAFCILFPYCIWIEKRHGTDELFL